jgi:hypothetical protein
MPISTACMTQGLTRQQQQQSSPQLTAGQDNPPSCQLSHGLVHQPSPRAPADRTARRVRGAHGQLRRLPRSPRRRLVPILLLSAYCRDSIWLPRSTGVGVYFQDRGAPGPTARGLDGPPTDGLVIITFPLPRLTMAASGLQLHQH